MSGPLTGLLVLEVGGIGPGPFAGMLFADLGAEVVRVDRPGGIGHLAPLHSILLRGRTSITLDLKVERDRDTVAKIAAQADVLIEGFRPGVMERLGLGPEKLLTANSRLVYGRMTGWGQVGPCPRQPGTTSTTSPLPAHSSRSSGPTAPRRHRLTCSATSAAEACY